MEFLLRFHGEMRWLVALVALVVGLRSLGGWTRGALYIGADRVMMSVLTILLDVNLLLGLILLVWLPGGLAAHRLEHLATMLLAVVAAHLSALWRGSKDPTVKFRNNFFVVVAVLLLVALGVFRLRGGWLF